MNFIPRRPSGAASAKNSGIGNSGKGNNDATTGFGGSQTEAETNFDPQWGMASIVGMPHGGATFIDGQRANDAASRWFDASMTRWLVPAARGRHTVMVVAPNGDRRVGSVEIAALAGPWNEVSWSQMKALPPIMRPSGRVTLPSGLAASQIADLQGALYALGHAPPTVITGRMPIGTQAQLLAFQTNYNAEQAARGYRYSPRTLDLDGGWGPNTQRALTNYIPWARTVLMQRGVLPGTVYSQNAPGVSMAPIGGQVTSTTPAKTARIGDVPTINPLAGGPLEKQVSPGAAPAPSMQGGASPQVAAPAPGVAPGVAPASTFPIVPVVVVGAGVIALGAALYLRSQPKGRKGGG